MRGWLLVLGVRSVHTTSMWVRHSWHTVEWDKANPLRSCMEVSTCSEAKRLCVCGREVRGLTGDLFRANTRTDVYVFDCTPARTYAPAGDRVELLSRHIEERGGDEIRRLQKHIPGAVK